MTDRIALARTRLSKAFDRAGRRIESVFQGISGGFRDLLTPALTDREQNTVARWMNSEAFSDRSREFAFNVTDPATGRTGEFRTTINGLMLIEPSYDSSKEVVRQILSQLVGDGILSYSPPSGPLPNQGSPGDWRRTLDSGGSVILPADTRIVSGLWGDFPPYGGIGNDFLRQPPVMLGTLPPSPGILPGFPVPQAWRRLFPGENFYRKNGSDWVLPDQAFVDILDRLTVHLTIMLKGANANVEWHPGVMAFNNGTQFPTSMYPPDFMGYAYDDVRWDYQRRVDHKWATTTMGARGSATGIVINGKSDSLWLSSLHHRQRIARAENHQLVVGHDWGKIEAADAAADFLRWCNMASFLSDVGATSHLHACLECHNSLSVKAMRELGLPVGSELETQVVREREARGIRQRMSRSQQLDQYVAQLQLAADDERQAASDTAGSILHGGLVASAQLFLANPIAGGVCAAVVAVASLMVYLFGGGQAERRTPELVLIRDGKVKVRETDESGDPQGDVYGGNVYPWSRDRAIRGTPIIRAKDATGRVFE